MFMVHNPASKEDLLAHSKLIVSPCEAPLYCFVES